MNIRKSAVRIAALLALAGILGSVLPTGGVQAAGQFTLKPVADAYVSVQAPDNNYGSSTSLRVDASPALRAYVRFDVAGLDGSISSAKLRILANSASGIGFNVKSVSDTSWDEKVLTWNNAPQIGGLIGETGSVSAGQWVTVDVTSVVKASGLVSFGITTYGETAINLAAREAGSGSAPQLVITTGGGAVTTATPSTPTPTPVGTATPTPVPPQPSSPAEAVLVGAGDITICGSTGDDKTAALLANIDGTIFTAGDNSNETGTAQQYQDCFNPTWGQYKSRIKPSVGNHDYLTTGASAYYAYFGSAAGPAGKGYYSYNLGSWHIVVLNTNCSAVGGCQAGSTQERWLRADLAANPARCTLAYWHHPRFSSGVNHGNSTAVQPLWQALYDNGAELVMNGHDHLYERFAPQTPTGALDSLNGIREFIVGTGGAGPRGVGTIQPNSEVQEGSTLGVLKLTLRSDSYSWNFIPVAGKTFTDAGSDVCH